MLTGGRKGNKTSKIELIHKPSKNKLATESKRWLYVEITNGNEEI
jgi:hypothetical protein